MEVIYKLIETHNVAFEILVQRHNLWSGSIILEDPSKTWKPILLGSTMNNHTILAVEVTGPKRGEWDFEEEQCQDLNGVTSENFCEEVSSLYQQNYNVDYCIHSFQLCGDETEISTHFIPSLGMEITPCGDHEIMGNLIKKQLIYPLWQDYLT